MGSFIRLVIGVPVAAIITVFLFYVMQDLIKTEEIEQADESEDLVFSINDEVTEVEARRRDTTIEDVQQVDPPPPPPQIERQRAEQPSEGLATVMVRFRTSRPRSSTRTVSASRSPTVTPSRWSGSSRNTRFALRSAGLRAAAGFAST